MTADLNAIPGPVPPSRHGPHVAPESSSGLQFGPVLHTALSGTLRPGSDIIAPLEQGGGDNETAVAGRLAASLDLKPAVLDLNGDTLGFGTVGVLATRAQGDFIPEFIEGENETLTSVAAQELASYPGAPNANEVFETLQLRDGGRASGLTLMGGLPSAGLSGRTNIGASLGGNLQGQNGLMNTTPIGAMATQQRPSTAMSSNMRVDDPAALHRQLLQSAQDAGLSDVDIQLRRGASGLVVIIVAPALDSVQIRTLERRITRLVQQSGETLNRVEIRTTGRLAPSFILPGH